VARASSSAAHPAVELQLADTAANVAVIHDAMNISSAPDVKTVPWLTS
jgi:hypothetical protein